MVKFVIVEKTYSSFREHVVWLRPIFNNDIEDDTNKKKKKKNVFWIHPEIVSSPL